MFQIAVACTLVVVAPLLCRHTFSSLFFMTIYFMRAKIQIIVGTTKFFLLFLSKKTLIIVILPKKTAETPS